jgi:DNA-binding MarR family transcriptional regulator
MMVVTPERLELLRLALLSARDTDRLLASWLDREAGLALRDLAALHAIDLKCDRLADLADRLAEPLPMVAEILSRLVGRDLVLRTTAAPTPRLQLTPAGERVLGQARELLEVALYDARHRLDDTDTLRSRRMLRSYLRLFAIDV